MISRLRGAGLDVLVESGAGDSAWFDDAAYARGRRHDRHLAGAGLRRGHHPDGHQARRRPASRAEIRAGGDRDAQPPRRPALAAGLARKGVTAISLDGIPRTLSKTQPMDALSSQANIAGYKAALVGGRRVRPVLPAAHHRRRHRTAGEGPGAWARRGGPAGHRDGPPARRGGLRLRRAAADQDRGGIARRHLHRADLGWARRPARAATRGRSPRTSGRRSRPSWSATSPGTTWSSPPHRCPGAGRRCCSPRTRSRRWRPVGGGGHRVGPARRATSRARCRAETVVTGTG
jgi:hypothetical protein